MMKRILTLMVLGVIVAISTVAKASELAPYVTSIDLYGSSNDWSEPIGRFEKDVNGVWHLDDVKIYDVTTFKLKLHINNPQGQESDVWFGIKNGDDQTLKSASPGTIVECSSASNAPNFRIGHPGKFSFTLNDNDINSAQFHFEGKFEENRFITGEFNNWGETMFTAWVGEYTLKIDPFDSPPMSGQFLIIDQDYNYLGGITDGEYYTITEDNPNVELATDAQGKKNLYLANDGYYSFTIDGHDMLTIENWPVEVVTVSIVGSTVPGWDMSNARIIPLTLDQSTGNYISEPTGILAGFDCQLLKHSSFNSVGDTWYGGSSDNFTIEIPEGTSEIPLKSSLGADFCFTDNGIFTFTLSPDFSTLNISGSYNVENQYFLIGDFNNWKQDEKVAFVAQDGVLTLTQEMVGEFLILDIYGNLLGGATNDNRYVLHEGWPSVQLTTDNKKNLYVANVGKYTLTIQNGILTVTSFPTDDYYICGDFNDWVSEPMTKNADGTYSIVMPIGEYNQFKFRDHQGNWYGGNTQGNGDTYLIHSEWCTDVPLTKGDSGSNFIINTTGSYKFILAGNDDALKLTVVGLGDITLAEALEGISGNISDHLYVAAVNQDKVYVTNGTDWLRLEGVYNAGELSEGYCVELTDPIPDGLSGKDTQPTFTIENWLSINSDDLQVPVIVNYSLAEPFHPMPKPCQVVNLEGWFFHQDDTSVLCAYNDQSGNYYPSIELSNTDDMEEGRMYNIKAAITLREPWQNIAPRIMPSDSNAIENLVAEVIEFKAKELPIATGIINTTDAATVVSVKYVNTAGQVSLKPFKGVNIVVTTHSDGNITTVKEVH
ncbi:MAG: hypothetical protein IK148_10260 [Prevotella sp.]|nr:hypothetical protein [Prevotella sp.]